MRRGSGIGLTCAALVAASVAGAEPVAEFVGRFVWTEPDDRFGGISGFDFMPGGTGFVAVSDSAAVFTGQMIRGAHGAVISVETDPAYVPLSSHGKPLHEPSDDAEGVAIAPDGKLLISYETQDRVVMYGQGGRFWMQEFWPEYFEGMQINGGPEALAMDDDGALYTMPERPYSFSSQIPVFLFRNNQWSHPFTLRRNGSWAPVGADFGPDGRLYILERDYWGLVGFMSRVRRITILGDQVAADEVILETSAGQHDNLEGLAVWRDTQGDIRLTMVSDNNFVPFRSTEIVDYRIAE
ncbi:MAG: esterase-like activity of phytase family protein [Albidovulum sp.]